MEGLNQAIQLKLKNKRKDSMNYKNKWVLFDLDGTLANHNHRWHHAKAKNWDMYHSLAFKDETHNVECVILKMFDELEMNICIITARSEIYREDTIHWLKKNDIWFDELVMRPESDIRPSWELKKEIILNREADGKETFCVFDDRPSIVDMVRGLGITCLQTQQGIDLDGTNGKENIA